MSLSITIGTTIFLYFTIATFHDDGSREKRCRFRDPSAISRWLAKKQRLIQRKRYVFSWQALDCLTVPVRRSSSEILFFNTRNGHISCEDYSGGIYLSVITIVEQTFFLWESSSSQSQQQEPS